MKSNKNTLTRLTVAFDISMAELHAIQGCLDFALSNTECSLPWAFGCEPEDIITEADWMTEVLETLRKKLESADCGKGSEQDMIVTFEQTDKATLFADEYPDMSCGGTSKEYISVE